MSNRCVIPRFGAPLIDKHRSPTNLLYSLHLLEFSSSRSLHLNFVTYLKAKPIDTCVTFNHIPACSIVFRKRPVSKPPCSSSSRPPAREGRKTTTTIQASFVVEITANVDRVAFESGNGRQKIVGQVGKVHLQGNSCGAGTEEGDRLDGGGVVEGEGGRRRRRRRRERAQRPRGTQRDRASIFLLTPSLLLLLHPVSSRARASALRFFFFLSVSFLLAAAAAADAQPVLHRRIDPIEPSRRNEAASLVHGSVDFAPLAQNNRRNCSSASIRRNFARRREIELLGSRKLGENSSKSKPTAASFHRFRVTFVSLRGSRTVTDFFLRRMSRMTFRLPLIVKRYFPWNGMDLWIFVRLSRDYKNNIYKIILYPYLQFYNYFCFINLYIH